jgi:CheY-like chemotaxis protein
MTRIRLICWNRDQAKQNAKVLQAAGYSVNFDLPTPDALRDLINNPPAALLIDLSRQPSQGRDIALALRLKKATRCLPLVFVEGDPEKVAGIKQLLPDATYTTWPRIRNALRRAITHPPTDPIVPQSAFAGYAGAPLTKKLGIKPDSTVVLIDAPQDFEKTLGQLPNGVTIRRNNRGRRDLTIWFTKSQNDLHKRIKRMVPLAENKALWILWPKKTSRLSTDLSQKHVRATGLAAGLVDYKICSVDTTWSALLFTKRKPTQS